LIITCNVIQPNYATGKVEQFAARFKNIEIAREFKQKFDEAQEYIKSAPKIKSEAVNTAAANTAAADIASAASATGMLCLYN